MTISNTSAIARDDVDDADDAVQLAAQSALQAQRVDAAVEIPVSFILRYKARAIKARLFRCESRGNNNKNYRTLPKTTSHRGCSYFI